MVMGGLMSKKLPRCWGVLSPKMGTQYSHSQNHFSVVGKSLTASFLVIMGLNNIGTPPKDMIVPIKINDEANDPVAILEEGKNQCNKGEYIKAFEYFTKAAELGDVEAHYKLACLYHDGLGVEQLVKGFAPLFGLDEIGRLHAVNVGLHFVLGEEVKALF